MRRNEGSLDFEGGDFDDDGVKGGDGVVDDAADDDIPPESDCPDSDPESDSIP